MIRRPPRSTLSSSSAASDVYKRQIQTLFGDDINQIFPSSFPPNKCYQFQCNVKQVKGQLFLLKLNVFLGFNEGRLKNKTLPCVVPQYKISILSIVLIIEGEISLGECDYTFSNNCPLIEQQQNTLLILEKKITVIKGQSDKITLLIGKCSG
eukprot:TRINITY_DN3143_c0_g1_i1.p2 TRINITY_DN3143_c0_g1~~TRINITY_DN3143_c0_g1_i1.p2  ORF type:complete len:152 (+),score=22.59 TRINITY_DN3143_c0_g1_i1:94-549(+)